mgnify:CR=1 FL=1
MNLLSLSEFNYLDEYKELDNNLLNSLLTNNELNYLDDYIDQINNEIKNNKKKNNKKISKLLQLQINKKISRHRQLQINEASKRCRIRKKEQMKNMSNHIKELHLLILNSNISNIDILDKVNKFDNNNFQRILNLINL